MDALVKAELQSDNMLAVPFIFLDFLGDPVRAWMGGQDVSWDGFTWTAVGEYGDISDVSANASGKLENITLTLMGFKAKELAAAKASSYRGRTGKVWLATFNTETFAMIGTPELMFAGPMASMPIGKSIGTDGPDMGVSIKIESRETAIARVQRRLRADTDHRRSYPTDGFFSQVNSLPGKILYWGMKAAVFLGGAGVAGDGDSSGGRMHLK